MKIITRSEMVWNGERYIAGNEQSYEYDGPVALCDRGESHAAFQQSEAAAAQDQAAAQAARSATNAELGTYKSNLSDFMNYGRSTFAPNGEYMADQNTIANTTAAAGARNLSGQMALNAARTGENTAGYASTLAEDQRQNERDVTSQLAGADASRLEALTNINQYGVQASALPASVEAGLYGSSISGANGQQGDATTAAQTKSGWDVFAGDIAAGAGAAIGNWCPCEGSLIQLHDGSEIRAELLEKGDPLAPHAEDDDAPANELTAKPAPRKQDCYEIILENGVTHAGSKTHTIALVGGGYGYMPELQGKMVLTSKGPQRVKTLAFIGEKWVVPLSVGGSHCYIADSVFCLA